MCCVDWWVANTREAAPTEGFCALWMQLIIHPAQEAESPVESAATLDSWLYVWAFSSMH